MSEHPWKPLAWSALTVILLASAAGAAGPLDPANPSFELPSLGDGGFAFTVQSWTIGGPNACGTVDPVAGNLVPASGNQVAFCQGGGMTLSAPAGGGGVVQNGQDYTLTVFVGERTACPASPCLVPPVYALELWDSTGTINCATVINPVVPPVGTMAPATLTIDSPTSPGAADCDGILPDNPCCGLPLRVVLITNLGGATNQITFDDVMLTPVELLSFSVE